MQEIYQHAATVFMAFFAVMNPIANTAVFVSLVGERSRVEQMRTASRSLVTVFAIVAVFALIGKLVFEMFGITLPALKVAGGVLVFLIGYQMLKGKKSEMHHPKDASINDENDDGDVAISPLAVPMLAGPGTLATAMNFSAQGGVDKVTVTIAAFGVLCLVTFVFFLLADRVVRLLGKSGLQIVTQLMGLILAVIGTQMLIDGVKAAIAIC